MTKAAVLQLAEAKRAFVDCQKGSQLMEKTPIINIHVQLWAHLVSHFEKKRKNLSSKLFLRPNLRMIVFPKAKKAKQ